MIPSHRITFQPKAVHDGGLATATAITILSLVALALFVVRLTGVPNFLDNEHRIGAFVLDAVQNGNWVCPHDCNGNMYKPPLLTWLSALVTLAAGHANAFTLYLPTALATVALSSFIFITGRRYFGWLAGFLGALAYLLSDVGAKQIASARWDGLFALPVMVGAIAAFRAWETGRGWTLFWLACGIATLVKGPLGVLLAASGLLACLWELWSHKPKPIRGSHLLGVIWFLAITGGWFLVAYVVQGHHLIEDMIGNELVGHALPTAARELGGRFSKPTLNFLTTFAPWSLLTVVGLVVLCVKPSADDSTRRFERFLFCGFAFGMVLFSISSHNPARLLYPIIPFAALIAGRTLAWTARNVKRSAVLAICAVVIVVFLGIFGAQYHKFSRGDQQVKESLSVLGLAQTVHKQVGADFPLTCVDTRYAMPFTFDTMRPCVRLEQAVALLQADAAAFVVVEDMPALRAQLGTNSPLYDLAQCPLWKKDSLHIVSNHPRLEWTDHMVTFIGPLKVRMDGVRLERALNHKLVVAPGSTGGSLTVLNESDKPQTVRICTGGKTSRRRQARTLQPGESWRTPV